MTGRLFADHALLPDGWARDVLIDWDSTGRIVHVQPGACAVHAAPGGPIGRVAGPLLPGMPNLHSHAFQRGMAGLTEYRGGSANDSFWSWRSLMYRFAARLDPESLEAIAFGLYVEMLEAGYTSVCEFHYVHHDVDGKPYADDATLAHAVLNAARRAGIGMTLLPVLYQDGGFGGQAAQPAQGRFIRSTESMLRLLERLATVCAASTNDDGAGPAVRLGLAPHSLRAVSPGALRDVLAGLDALDRTAPIHIHIAEQQKEVDDCIAWSGQRPVEWLLDHVAVDERWCLVHATHMTTAEHRRAAATGAVAGLCPSTEANLGDGLFDLPVWQTAGGAWGVGSDSHACVDAAEELMLLEYAQRLATRQRNVGADARQPHVATAMTLAAVSGGARASGRAVGGIAVGQQADLVALDAQHRALVGLAPQDMLSSHVFASSRGSAIDSVWVGGRRRVEQGRHTQSPEARAGFARARAGLLR
ncbi:MAG: formimidoylglutamate deiminase [Comamonadaceae bacterium]|nr:MAG: formimidoylglutamate deiminase [Comamonadaceae bacterium]